MNSWIGIGRLAKDPELRYTPSQVPVCNMILAVDRPVRQGEQKQADFIRVSVWGKQAENCNKFLSKGRQAAVHGRIETGSYKNKHGDTVYTTDILADRVEFLGGSQQGGNQQNSPQRSNFEHPAYSPAEEYDPFGEAEQMGFMAVDEDIEF